MRKILFLVGVMMMVSTIFGATGWYQDYVLINSNNAGESYFWIGSDPSYGTEFAGNNFGNVNSLLITGCDMKYWGTDADRTGGAFYYKIMNSGGSEELVAATEVIWSQASIGGNDFQGTNSDIVDILGLYDFNPGTTYELHVWAKSWGTSQGDSWLSNGGANYVATFTYRETSYTGTGDWDNSGNWDYGVPSEYSNVIIDGIVTLTSDETVKNITVAADASLTVNATKSLTVGENLTIKSDATGTGSLITNGTLSGNVSVERYLTNYDNSTDVKYHFISSPVSSQAIQPEFVTDPPTAGVDFYKFDEETNTWINSKVSGGAWNSGFEDNFVVGKGYLAAYPTTPETKEFSGTLNNDASYSLTCTYTDGQGNGWNLLGNPYPAAIDWDAVTLGDGVDNALYYYDASTQNYIAYLRISGDNSTSTGGSRYIPAGQGFMVHANNTGSTKTVTIEKTDLTHTGQDVYYKSSTNLLAGSLSLQVTGNNFSDKTIIHFNEQATTDFDGNYDAFKLMSANMQVPMIYTGNKENTQFAINGLPQVVEGISIPVSLRIGADGTYIVEANINEIETNIFLEDLFTGTTTKLNETSTYTFTASEGDNENRFKLHFGATGVNEIQKEALQAYMSGQNLFVIGEEGAAQLSVYDIQGKQLFNKQVELNSQFRQTLDLPQGVYVVSVQSKEIVKTAKVIIK